MLLRVRDQWSSSFDTGQLEMHRLMDHILGKPQRANAVGALGNRYEDPSGPAGLAMADIIAGSGGEQMNILDPGGDYRS